MVQRVTEASVTVSGERVSAIGRGLLVFLGVGCGDTVKDADFVCDKLVHMRIFADGNGKMNCSLLDCGGEMLLVSQFTLYGNAQKGRRPSFIEAAPPGEAEALYRYALERIASFGVAVGAGVFGADMQVALVNDGPVTICLDTRRG